MIPISDDNPTLRFPVVTVLLLIALGLAWVLVQGAGFDPVRLAATVCNLGLVPGEITGQAAVGTAVPLGMGLYCVVDREPINILTPLLSMFLHGGWAHLLGNGQCGRPAVAGEEARGPHAPSSRIARTMACVRPSSARREPEKAQAIFGRVNMSRPRSSEPKSRTEPPFSTPKRCKFVSTSPKSLYESPWTNNLNS